jgi:hypothetical protein
MLLGVLGDVMGEALGGWLEGVVGNGVEIVLGNARSLD